jgi:hypothetical protein
MRLIRRIKKTRQLRHSAVGRTDLFNTHYMTCVVYGDGSFGIVFESGEHFIPFGELAEIFHLW